MRTDTTETYNLAYTSTSPAVESHDIKHRERRDFFDQDFVFSVIGSSHYVGCEELGYHELLTCEPLDEADLGADDGSGFWDRNGLTKTVPLAVGHSERLRHVVDGVGVETEIVGETLQKFRSPEEFDISYRFEGDAYTTIHLVANDTYRTYHTYPEYDLALRTDTSLVRFPSDTSR